MKAAAESAMREVIGRSPIQPTWPKAARKIEHDAKVLLQRILDEYGAGIEITQVQLQKVDPPAPVIDAFRDVQRARADLERQRNEAEAYRNDIMPRARGEAERLIQEAEATAGGRRARQGDAKRFLAVYRRSSWRKDVTKQRLYLETMEEILRRTNKVIIDQAARARPAWCRTCRCRSSSAAPADATPDGSRPMNRNLTIVGIAARRRHRARLCRAPSPCTRPSRRWCCASATRCASSTSPACKFRLPITRTSSITTSACSISIPNRRK